jgi:hypothetical protein
MEYSISSVILELPKPIREQLSRYRSWLNQNFNVILQRLPKKSRSKVNKVDFVEFAILRLVYDIPTRGLKTIEDSLDLLQTHDIQAISITGKVFQKNSGPLVKISELVETLKGIIKEYGFDFVITYKDLTELAMELAGRDYEQE